MIFEKININYWLNTIIHDEVKRINPEILSRLICYFSNQLEEEQRENVLHQLL